MDDSSISRSASLVKRRLRDVAYLCQVVAIFTVIVACIVNLTLGDDKAALWSSFLSGALGYLLPAPKIRKDESSFLPNITEQQLCPVLSRQHSNAVHDSPSEPVSSNRRMGGSPC
jgi:hypothetical protein